MQYRALGNSDVKLSAIGLGCMSMNHAYGEPDDAESIATLERSIELGINFWDTADIYANGANEELVSRVLQPNRQKVFIATKFGFLSYTDGKMGRFDASPAHAKEAVEASLRRLKTDVIDLYYAHRIDPNVPVEDTVGAMADLVKEGKVRYLGLSEASPESIRRAHAVHPISALQSEYSILTREVEKEVLPLCKELHISFIPFSPLARGLMTNTLDLANLGAGDFRRTLPRYQGTHAANNRLLSEAFAELAASKGCSPAQLAIAWVLAQGENIIPIPGTKRRKYLNDNVGALDVVFSPNDFDQIEQLLERYPDIGDRYNAANYQYLEKK
jgi:aryl-alcohol dehydrogenase-like predicted oxidoreductase